LGRNPRDLSRWLPVAVLRYLLLAAVPVIAGSKLNSDVKAPPRDENSLNRESVDYRTTRQLTGSTAPHGVRHDKLHGSQIGYFCPNLGQVTCRELAYLSACVLRIIR
jgi:hypothetical protein